MSKDIRRKVGPLKLTGILSAIEILVWLALGYAGVRLTNRPLTTEEAIFYVADHFGELVLGLATTAYVIFTYYLLQDAEAQRKRTAEPYLTLRWLLSDQPATERMKAFQKLAQRSCDWLAQTLGINLALDSLTPVEQRYVNLEISNIRDTSVSWFDIAITASASVPDQKKPWTSQDRLDRKDLVLERGRRMLLTVLDLGGILTTASVSLRIDSLVYGPLEAGTHVIEFAGDRNFEIKGTWIPAETGFKETQ